MSALNPIRLRWLGRVLRTTTEWPPRCRLSSKTSIGWKVGQSGQSMTWQKSMKSLNGRLMCVKYLDYRVGVYEVSLSGDGRKQWVLWLNFVVSGVLTHKTSSFLGNYSIY